MLCYIDIYLCIINLIFLDFEIMVEKSILEFKLILFKYL